MTQDEVKTARLALRLSVSALARLLELGKWGYQTVGTWEAGENKVPGPVSVLLRLLLKLATARRAMGLPPVLVKPGRDG